ncbi:MAG: hypothetical protein ACOX4J_01460 [Anaerovoracaceae bacterium]|jgi:hypothetical protein
MKRARTVIGLLLIVVALAGLIFWEVKGREAILLDTVIVASETIPAGTVITRDRLSPSGVLEQNRIQGSLDWEALPRVIGQVAMQDILKNAQVSEKYLADKDFYLRNHESIFVIHPEWIAMRSSSIRRGDWVDIYEGAELKKIGTYRVAFVKDANETEVTDGEGNFKSNSLDRIASTSPVSHIEIITDISEYKKIAQRAQDSEAGLLLVQKQVVGR